MIKPFGPKAAQFIKRPPEEDATINLLDGSTGASKTWTANAKLVSVLAQGYWPGGVGLVSGNSKTSVKTNCLNDLFSIVGTSRYKYNQQSGELILMGRPFIVCGAKDEGSWRAIRGSTVSIWLGDEATLYPQSFFEMAVSRLRLSGSRAYLTTNPATPFHYLKRQYIDNPQKRSNGDFDYQHYTLDDNPNMPEERKEFLKRQFVGVFYRRYILGEWCVADGSIYGGVLTDDIFYTDQWREQAMPGLLNNGGHTARYILIDYGTTNAFAALDVYDDGDIWYVEDEMYWDSREKNVQKTDSQYADDLRNFIGPIHAELILDPSAASFSAELATRGIFVTDADNEVQNGIRMTATALARKKIRINKKCKNLIREMQSYAWNDKSAERGVEEPIKAHDHSCDALRYGIRTKLNEWRLAA